MLFSIEYKIQGKYKTAYFESDSFEEAIKSVNNMREGWSFSSVVKTTKIRTIHGVLHYMYETLVWCHGVQVRFRLFLSDDESLTDHLNHLSPLSHTIQHVYYSDL